MLSLRQSYAFTSSILCFQKPHVPLWQSQSYASPPTKCHIDVNKVPHRQAASPTLATTRLFAAENSDEISLHSPVFAAAHFYLFHKNTSPPHLTPRKARYTKGLKQVRCRSNTSLTPHWHLPDTYLKKWGGEFQYNEQSRQEQTLFKYHNNDDEDNPDYLPKKDAECLKNKK